MLVTIKYRKGVGAWEWQIEDPGSGGNAFLKKSNEKLPYI